MPMKDFKIALTFLFIFGLLSSTNWALRYVNRNFYWVGFRGWEGIKMAVTPIYYYAYWTIFCLIIAAAVVISLWYWAKKNSRRPKLDRTSAERN